MKTEHISKVQILKWLEKTGVAMIENKEHLTDLDAAVGDADHGINMERGFKKVLEKLDSFSEQDIGSILKNTGMTLISSVGGASGPLYGTLYMQMGVALANKEVLDINDLYKAFNKGMEGVKSRGKAIAGEKTMIDVFEPVVETLALNAKEPLQKMLNLMTLSAKKGMEATINMIAKKGRASYLGPRSSGHQDAGATSSYLIIKTLEEVVVTKD